MPARSKIYLVFPRVLETLGISIDLWVFVFVMGQGTLSILPFGEGLRVNIMHIVLLFTLGPCLAHYFFLFNLFVVYRPWEVSQFSCC